MAWFIFQVPQVLPVAGTTIPATRVEIIELKIECKAKSGNKSKFKFDIKVETEIEVGPTKCFDCKST